MRKKLWTILVLTIVVASTLVGCGSSPATLTILSMTDGNVSVMKEGTGSWTEARLGMSLEVGDSVKTSDDSSAEITFFEGSTIELQAGTEIEIASLDISAGTGSTTITLEQTIGNTISRVIKLLDPASRYEVETPTGVVAVRGSVMQVYVIEDGTTRATNLEGDIWAVAQGVELQIPEGRQCIINPGQPPELEIRDWYDLDAIRDNLSGSYVLMNDLDSTTPGYEELASPTANGGQSWDPIGSLFVDDPFTGSMDGQGYEIRDLFIDRPDGVGVGLFGCVINGVIGNLGVVSAEVIGLETVGGLVGLNEGTISDAYFTGSVTGGGNVGGLVGETIGTGTMRNSFFTGSVTGGGNVGGLVGLHLGAGAAVSNSHYNYSEVLISRQNIITIGALFGEDFEQWLADDKFLDVNERLSQENGYYVINSVDDFKELLAFGQDDSLKFRLKDDVDLAGEPDFYIPYLAGEFDGNGHKITNLSLSSKFGFVSGVGLFGYVASGGKITRVAVEDAENTNGEGSHVGGLVGRNEGIVSNSYLTGMVTGAWSVGGLVGQNGGPVTNSYFVGSVTGDHWVGGLLGSNTGTANNCYSSGSVTGEDSVGGLVGYNYDVTVTVSNSFWDMETSGQDTSDAGTGKTTEEMQDIATFTAVGWDIIAVDPGVTNPAYIWNIVDGETYPFLSWQLVS